MTIFRQIKLMKLDEIEKNEMKSCERGEGERMYIKRVDFMKWHHSSFTVSRVKK